MPDKIDALIAKLDRAHRMSTSDPEDPARLTLWGEARDALSAARAALEAALTTREGKA